MSKLFSAPKIAPAPEPKALPREDDEAVRRAKLKTFAGMQRDSGRESTRLSGASEARLGDYSPAMTRGSAVMSG